MKLSVIICGLLFTGMLLAADAQQAPAPAQGRLVKTPYGDVTLFPSDYPLNQPIADAQVHENSDAFIRSIGEARILRPGFGHRDEDGSPMGFRIFTIPGDQKKVKVNFELNEPASQDMIDYPIPDEAAALKGSFGNRCVILDPANKKLYELGWLRKEQAGWKTFSGLCFDLTSAKLRQVGKKGGCSSGLPCLAGLVTVQEVQAGKIEHAMLVSVKKTQKGWISPACGFASVDANQDLPPMGLRLRLRKDFDTSNWLSTPKMIAEALKTYGMLIADNGTEMELWGEASPWWEGKEVDKLRNIKAADFEVVDTGPIENP
ncbi:MAG: hypothetical protein LAQ69_51825 [Acidobacteriia bacterium]|nr:hypothetical protein [Terriglobia bacterium]